VHEIKRSISSLLSLLKTQFDQRPISLGFSERDLGCTSNIKFLIAQKQLSFLRPETSTSNGRCELGCWPRQSIGIALKQDLPVRGFRRSKFFMSHSLLWLISNPPIAVRFAAIPALHPCRAPFPFAWQALLKDTFRKRKSKSDKNISMSS
jgi:hypothetical protein